MRANLKRQERRWYPRAFDVDGTLPGALTRADSDAAIDCEVCDVSEDGLGIITDQEFSSNMELILDLTNTKAKAKIRFRIVHCRPESMRKGFHRCGLQAIDNEINLIELFAAEGRIKGGSSRDWWS
jgi:hypothetical protein